MLDEFSATDTLSLGMQNVRKSLPFLPKGSDVLSNVNEGHDYERVR